MAYELMKKVPTWVKKQLAKMKDDQETPITCDEKVVIHLRGKYYRYKVVRSIGSEKVYRERLNR